MNLHRFKSAKVGPSSDARTQRVRQPALAAALRGRLDRVARRDPAAVLGVLEYWLAAEAEGESRDD